MKILIGADFVPTQSNLSHFNAGNAEHLFGTELLDILKSADARIFIEVIRKLFIVGEEPILKVPEKCRGFVLTAQGLQILFADIHKLKPDFAESAQNSSGNSVGDVAVFVVRICAFNKVFDFQKFRFISVISFALVNDFIGSV